MKRLISLACLVATLTACVAGVAFAATRYETKLTISYSRASKGHFSGKVKSQKHACIASRKVTVYRKEARARPGDQLGHQQREREMEGQPRRPGRDRQLLREDSTGPARGRPGQLHRSEVDHDARVVVGRKGQRKEFSDSHQACVPGLVSVNAHRSTACRSSAYRLLMRFLRS